MPPSSPRHLPAPPVPAPSNDVFAAIAHPVRRQILDTLAQDSMTVTEIAAPFEISRPAISQHLGILLESGLVSVEKRGREHYYELRPEALSQVYRWLKHYERFWTGKLDALEHFLDSQPPAEPPDET